jgi:hypothetical protein
MLIIRDVIPNRRAAAVRNLLLPRTRIVAVEERPFRACPERAQRVEGAALAGYY